MNPKITKWFADLAARTMPATALIGLVSTFLVGPVALLIGEIALTWFLFCVVCLALAMCQYKEIDKLIKEENREKGVR